MSAERMAEIEARLAAIDSAPQWKWLAMLDALVAHAPADLRWLLDRVRELEGRAIAPVTTTAPVEVGLRRNRLPVDRLLPPGHCPYCDSIQGRSNGWAMPPDGWQQMQRDHDAGHIAARSPSGEGQP